jgi:putative transposase
LKDSSVSIILAYNRDMTLTYHFRLKDKHSSNLNRQAKAINFVWNYCNEIQRYAVKNKRKWLSGYDLCKLTAGTSKELNLRSASIQRTCIQYDKSRRQHCKAWLKFRSHKKSLGWIPFSTQDVKFDGKIYQAMHLYGIVKGQKLGAGSFSRDSRGKWYLNCTAEVEEASQPPNDLGVGIDLGLKSLATLSTGESIEPPKFFHKHAEKLAKAQRAHKKRQVTNIHAKIKNSRKYFLHNLSKSITQSFGLIVVGDVSPSKLARTNLAKSVMDAGWSNFKHMLSYKSIRNGGKYFEVNEGYTTQTCSNCQSKTSNSRPKGIAGLEIREWTCSDCGAVLNRDVNAARNILRLKQQPLVGGALSLS